MHATAPVLYEVRYRLEELISRRVPLKEVNHAFDLLRQGEVKRSVVVYD
jgi:Zn-dependent alcohol dehydrogenase